jgi:hypothetical protein
MLLGSHAKAPTWWIRPIIVVLPFDLAIQSFRFVLLGWVGKLSGLHIQNVPNFGAEYILGFSFFRMLPWTVNIPWDVKFQLPCLFTFCWLKKCRQNYACHLSKRNMLAIIQGHCLIVDIWNGTKLCYRRRCGHDPNNPLLHVKCSLLARNIKWQDIGCQH